MKIQYSCDVSQDNKKVIESLIAVWASNNPLLREGEWVLEVRKLLSRSFTRAITFLARYVRPGREGISRVFKIDLYDNIQIEAQGAIHLDSTISAKFFCRVKNNPANDFWNEPGGDLFGIIEYEYAGDMGTSDTVDTLQTYINEKLEIIDNKSQVKELESVFKPIFDDVIQGLKSKVYKRSTIENVTVQEVYKNKLKHFSSDFVFNAFQDLPPYLEKVYNFSPQVIFNDINNILNLQLKSHYLSDYIHGDLNPTNILVYSGFDRSYATMIDFLEIERKREESFTPYFWDFARLEAELTLSFFNHGYIPKNDIKAAIEDISNTQFNMELASRGKLEIYFVSNLILQLRRSFFRTQGLNLDISFHSPDVLKSFYVNLFVFYLFITKFKNSKLEMLVSLIFAHKLALEIKNIDSKWAEDRITKLEKEDNRIRKSKSLYYIAGLSIVTLIIAIYLVFQTMTPKFPVGKLEVTEKLIEEKLYDDALRQFTALLHDTDKSVHPYYYSRIKLGEGRIYFYKAEKENREVNLKNAKVALEEALKHCNQKENKKLASAIYYNLARSYVQYSLIREGKSYLEPAITNFEKALSLFSRKKQPYDYAKIQLSLGEAYIRFSEVKDRKKNLDKANKLITDSLQYFTMTEFPVEFAQANHNFGTVFLYYSFLNNQFDKKISYIKQSINFFKIALEIRKLEKYPLEYAKTQNNLGIAYSELANYNNKENNLGLAIESFKESLSIHSYKNQNVDYAKTKINLVRTYRKLASISNPEENLKKAINESQDIFKIISVINFPRDFAKAQINLGASYYSLFQLKPEQEFIENSIKAFNKALKIFTKNEYEDNYAETQKNLGQIYLTAAPGAIETDVYISKSTLAFQEALEYYIRKGKIEKIIKVSDAIGDNYLELAGLKENLEYLNKAKTYYNTCLKYIDKKKKIKDYEQISLKLKQISEIQSKFK